LAEHEAWDVDGHQHDGKANWKEKPATGTEIRRDEAGNLVATKNETQEEETRQWTPSGGNWGEEKWVLLNRAAMRKTNKQTKQQTNIRRRAQIWEQHITNTKQIGDETLERKSEICSIKLNKIHIRNTKVTTLPPSFNWKQKFGSWLTLSNLSSANES
jgi:hypothetical protein